MKKTGRYKGKCLYCQEVFYIPMWRFMQGEKEGHRRGVFCSEPCRRKVYKMWWTLGMKRDKEYQALLSERAKLRRLVLAQKKAAPRLELP